MSELHKFCKLLQEHIKLQIQLKNFKLSEQQVQSAYTQIDTDNKGWIDINNLAKFCYHLNNKQLHYIFNYLDLTSSGMLFKEDLIQRVSIFNTKQKLQTNNIKKSIEQYFKALIFNLQLVQQKRYDLNIRQEDIRIIANRVLNEYKTDVIQVQLLIQYFSKYLVITKDMIDYLINHIFRGKQLSANNFINYFCPLSYSQTHRNSQNSNKATTEQKQTMKNIIKKYSNDLKYEEIIPKYPRKHTHRGKQNKLYPAENQRYRNDQHLQLLKKKSYDYDTQYSAYSTAKYSSNGIYRQFRMRNNGYLLKERVSKFNNMVKDIEDKAIITTLAKIKYI